jgi:uncharacterized protein YegL
MLSSLKTLKEHQTTHTEIANKASIRFLLRLIQKRKKNKYIEGEIGWESTVYLLRDITPSRETTENTRDSERFE